MNTRIEKDFFCQTAVHYNGKFNTNTYSITLSMLVEECDDPDEPNIAMDRATYFIENYIQSSLLINIDEKIAVERYKTAGINICELPSEPHDQIFAAVLLLKLNAIMEGRIKITDLLIGSAMSNGVRYNVVSEVAESTLSGNYWWNKMCLATCDESELTTGNVVKLFEDDPWIETGLSWNEKDS
jgi:hypothetical protein